MIATESIIHQLPYHNTHAPTKRDYNQIPQFMTLAIETATVGNSITVSNYSSREDSRQTNRQFRCSLTLDIRVLMFLTARLFLERSRRKIFQAEPERT